MSQKLPKLLKECILCPTLHPWLTYQSTFKNHENLPTCILDFIEQYCEVWYKISKQTVRYRLSKIARIAEGVLHDWRCFDMLIRDANLGSEALLQREFSFVMFEFWFVMFSFIIFLLYVLLCFSFQFCYVSLSYGLFWYFVWNFTVLFYENKNTCR